MALLEYLLPLFSWPSLITALLLYYLVNAIMARHKLRDFDGPFLATFSYLWLFRTALSGRAYQIHLAHRRRFGYKRNAKNDAVLIRIAPDMLITDDPAIFTQINSVHAGYSRGEWYSVMRLDPHMHNMISSPETAFHDDIKARTTAGYSGREVPTMERDIDGQIARLKSLIWEKYMTRQMDWGMVAQYFALDSLTRVAHGESFGCLAADDDVYGYIRTVEEAGFYFAVCSDVPWMGRVFLSDWMLHAFGPKPTDRKGMGVMMALAESIVAKRFGPDGFDGQDMLGSFIRHGLPQKQCEAAILAHLVAGSDTTANYLRMALVLLVTNPRVYRKLQDGIDEGISRGTISHPITNAEAQSFSYLQAFLYECFRFRPPVAMLFPKVVPRHGDVLGGKFVRGGTKIAVDTWSMGRRADIYGEDVDVFRPERFLEVSTQKRAEMVRTAELIFGSGRYTCPGKNMALMELNKVFVELLRDFDIQIVNPERPFTISHRSMFVIRDVWLVFTARKE